MFLYRSKNKKNTKLRARISAVLISVQILSLLSFATGCGAKSSDAPELNEPVMAEVQYRPVSKRTIGKKEIMYGHVVPRDYPCFSKNGADIAEVKVATGDFVNEGDVIATGVSTMNSEIIAGLQEEINSLNRQRTTTQEVSDKVVEKLQYERKIEEYLEDSDGIWKKDKEIEKEQEELRFNLALIDSRIASAKSEIADIQNDSKDVVFTAPFTGYVTFVKDFSQTNHVEPNENIAVISDMDELYIESSEKTIDNYTFEDYKKKWTYLNGKKVYITERRYTNEEVSCAKAIKANPFIQFEVPGEKLTIGTDMVLYFMDSDDAEKLVVGNDSIYRDNDSAFVYVKGPDDSNTDEKRAVKLGVSDGNYTEVISGLEEGELVYYNNNAAIPLKYEISEVELKDYEEKCETQFISLSNPYSKIYTADYSGKIQEIHNVGLASAGDTLFTLQTNVKRADVEAAKSTVKELDTTREKERKEYEKAKTDLEEVIRMAGEMPAEEMATDSDALRETMYLAERAQCDLDILTYNENLAKQEYDAQRAAAQKEYNKLAGAGFESGGDYVKTSDIDGNINSYGPSRNARVEKYQYIITEQYRKEEEGSTRLHVLVDSSDPSMPNVSPKIGEEVTFFNKEKSWTGKCLGINGNPTRFILFTQGEKQYTTYSSPFYKEIEDQFEMVIDDDITEEDLEDAKVRFNGLEVKQATVVPAQCVKSEYDQLAQKEIYFVWKLENDEIVKEYVTVHDTVVATGTVFILDGVEVGDKLLK